MGSDGPIPLTLTSEDNQALGAPGHLQHATPLGIWRILKDSDSEPRGPAVVMGDGSALQGRISATAVPTPPTPKMPTQPAEKRPCWHK